MASSRHQAVSGILKDFDWQLNVSKLEFIC